MTPYNKVVYYLNESEDFIDETDEFMDDDLNEEVDFINEAEDENNEPKAPMDDEKLRIESVKLATSIAKLMNNVTPEDIIQLSGIVASYIRNNNNQDLSAAPADNADFGDDFTDDDTQNEE